MNIDKEAADWFARMRGPGATRMRAQFDAWYADPSHAEAFDSLSRSWEQSKFLANTPVARSRDLSRIAGSSRKRLALTAAVIGAGLFCAALVMQLFPQPGAQPADRIPPPSTKTSDTALRDLVLEDGSRVQLGRNARLELAYSSEQRALHLVSGRARFRVQHSDPRPFVVNAGAGSITATGTIFDVAVLDDQVDVFLIRGTVSVANMRERVSLAAGQKVGLTKDGISQPAISSPADLTWAGSMLDFDHTPLREAIARFNRTSAMTIRLDASAFDARLLTGTFLPGDARSFAQSIAAAFDLEIRVNHDESLSLVVPRGKPGPEKTIG